jgi:hypothetical protein
VAFLFLVIGLALCGSPACSSPPPQITIEGPMAELSPVFLGVASIYVTVQNSGGKDALVAVKALVPNTVAELHDVQNSRMVKVERIAVPARGELRLGPGTLHAMVFNLPRTMTEGDELALTLTFERAGVKEITARLERPGAGKTVR